MTPTMPIDSAIGMRMNASSIIATSPTRASVMRRSRPCRHARSGGGLRGAPAARRVDLVAVDHAGEREHQRHEIHERPDEDLEDVGGISVRRDAARLDPHLPGEEEEYRRAQRMHDPDQY